MMLLTVLVISFVGIAHGASGRIVGGWDASNHKYPYQVSLRHLEIKHFCSGSILNENWILTAAHCVNDINANDYTVHVGTNYLNETGERYTILFHVVHDNYTQFYHDDIALIRVSGKIAFNDFVMPVKIAQSDLSDYTVRVEMSGWGSIQYGRPMSNELQEIELRLVTFEECRLKGSSVTSQHICTFTKIGEGICMGDSGGPLVIDGIQVGIASYVILPCAVGSPDVYSRVWSYRDWIDRTIKRYDNMNFLLFYNRSY